MPWTCLTGLILSAFTVTHSPLIAPDRGGYVTTLGRDTIAVERFTWSNTELRGEVVQTSPKVSRATYSVMLASNGLPRAFTIELKNVNDTNPALRFHMTFDRDSTRYTRTQGATTKYDAAPAESAVYPENLYFWALYELQARAMSKAIGDSVPFRLVSVGGPKPHTTVFRRRAADTLSTMFFYPEYWMNYVVDKSGALLAVDGSHTTIKVLARRQPDVPLEAFLASAAQRERSAGAVGAMSRFDSVNTTVGDLGVSVAYSRPAARGRKIWGDIVPFDAVWRTGANSATRLHLSGPLVIGGAAVPAGDYTLFSLPSATGALLIINKQVGQWGTEYHEDRDLVRVPVTAQRVGTRSELFTIRFAPNGAAQDLIIEWDDMQWTIPVRRPAG